MIQFDSFYERDPVLADLSTSSVAHAFFATVFYIHCCFDKVSFSMHRFDKRKVITTIAVKNFFIIFLGFGIKLVFVNNVMQLYNKCFE
jgi:hypothetical protein